MLEVRDIAKAFGAIEVIRDVGFVVEPGTCLGIIGGNGAGKSTLFDLITGTTRADRGKVLLAGQDISHLGTSARAQAGVARAFQVPRAFASLTVAEHLRLAASGRGTREATSRSIDDLLDLTGLRGRRDTLGGALRLLDRKRLELAKAMALEPRVILLDEVSGRLTEHEVDEMTRLISGLKDRGLAVMWIEHIPHALRRVCDRIMVLHLGRKIVEGPPDEVIASEDVRALYLGSTSVD